MWYPGTPWYSFYVWYKTYTVSTQKRATCAIFAVDDGISPILGGLIVNTEHPNFIC